MKPPTPDTITPRRTLVSASLWVTLGMLAGRFAGVAREFLIADTFGVSREADLAILLVAGPDLIVTLVGTGAVGLVLIPILLDLPTSAQLSLLRRLTLRLAAISWLVALLVAAIVLLTGADWATESELSTQGFRLAVVSSALSLAPTVTASLSAAFLRAQDRFAVVSFATVTFTLPILFALVMFRSVVAVGVGVAIGGMLRYGAQVAVIGVNWRSVPGPSELAVDTVRWTDIVVASGTSVLVAAQLMLPLGIAAVLGESGDLAVLNFGWKLLLIPIGLLSTLISVAAYPSLVRALGAHHHGGRRELPRAPLRLFIGASCGVSIWLWVNASGTVNAIYGSAGIESADLTEIASEVRAGAPAVALLTIGTIATSTMFALKDKRNALRPFLIATPILAGAGVALFVRYGPVGILIAVTIYAAVLCLTAVFIADRVAHVGVITRQEAAAGLALASAVVGLAVLIRQLIPGNGLVTTAVNGLIFVSTIAATSAVVVRRRRTAATSDSD